MPFQTLSEPVQSNFRRACPARRRLFFCNDYPFTPVLFGCGQAKIARRKYKKQAQLDAKKAQEMQVSLKLPEYS